MNLPDPPPSEGKPHHLLEDIFILLCILVIWPVILGWNHLIYEIPELRAMSFDTEIEFQKAELFVEGGLITLPWLSDIRTNQCDK